MVFEPPAWVPQLPVDPPDSCTIFEFTTDEKYGRHPIQKSHNPFTCGITGKTYSTTENHARTELMARALSKRMGWTPNEGTPWEKVVCVFSFNTIDYTPLLFAVHRLSGIVSPANVAYSADELEHQLKTSGAKVLVTCVPALKTALKAAKGAGIPQDKVFLLELPGDAKKAPFKTAQDLVDEGNSLPPLEPLKWSKGQGARQVAFLVFSSGTSGLPKAVMVSHYNVIANVLQYSTHESYSRKLEGIETQVSLGLLPFSHIYGLVMMACCAPWRGDGIIVLPKFDMPQYLKAIERFRINQLYVVPPIVVRMLGDKELCKKHDLSSVRFLFIGAAPTGKETIEDMLKTYPKWRIGQGYGMTELATIVVSSSEHDIVHGSSGSLMPACRAKVMDLDGKEITEHNKQGELWIQSPSHVLGYLNNEQATAEAIVWDDDGRWMRTGDEVIVFKAPSGNEHIAIVDRLKELIKVKGHQVAPAELESHLLSHPAVDDCAVIAIPHSSSGEAPKAFVVKSPAFKSKNEKEVAADIAKWVKDNKAHYKQLKGGVEFVEVIPKSPSGKILRRLLRDREREARRAKSAKL